MSCIVDLVTGDGFMPHVSCRNITLTNSPETSGIVKVKFLLEMYQDKNRLLNAGWLNELDNPDNILSINFLDAIMIQPLVFKQKSNVMKLKPSYGGGTTSPAKAINDYSSGMFEGGVYAAITRLGTDILPRKHFYIFETEGLSEQNLIFDQILEPEAEQTPLSVRSDSLIGDLSAKNVIPGRGLGPVREQLINGKMYYVVPFEYECEYDIQNDSNLGVSFHTFLHVPMWMQGLQADGISFDQQVYADLFEQYIVEGPINTEIVFLNNELQQTREAFFLPSGQAWEGAVHLHATGYNPAPDGYQGDGLLSSYDSGAPYRGWMAGSDHHSPNLPKLRLAEVSNNKIVDYRIGSFVEPLDGPLGLGEQQQLYEYNSTGTGNLAAYLSKAFLSTFQKEKRKDFIKDNDSEFSKLYVTRDLEGSARGLVFINILELLKNNSKLFPIFFGEYDPLLKPNQLGMKIGNGTYTVPFDLAWGEGILEKCPILELKIYRDRVKKKVLNTRYEKFANDEDYEEPSKLIATISDVNGAVGSASTLNNSSISELSGLPDSGLLKRYFQFTDTDVRREVAGLYRYRIELKVKDGSYDALYNRYRLLTNAKMLLNDYYDLAVSSYTPQETAGFNFDQTLVPEEYKKAPFKRYFSQGAFTYPDFYNAAIEKFPSTGPAGIIAQPWNLAPYALQTVQNLFGLFPDLHINGLGNLSQIISSPPVKNMLDPQNGTPHGIELFGRIMDSFIKKIESLLQGTKLNKSGSELSSVSLPNGYSFQNIHDVVVSPSDATIVEHHSYDHPSELFEAISNKNVYSDYLSIGTTMPATFFGLRSLSIEYYKDRCWLETAKLSPVAETFEGFTNMNEAGEIGMLVPPGPTPEALVSSVFTNDNFENQAYSYLAPSIVELSDALDNTPVYNFYYTAFHGNARQNLGDAAGPIHSFNFRNWINYDDLFISLINYSYNKRNNINADLTNRYFATDLASNQEQYGVLGAVQNMVRAKEPFKRLFEQFNITMHESSKYNAIYNRRPGPTFPDVEDNKEFPLKADDYSDFSLQISNYCKNFLYSRDQNLFSVDMSPVSAPSNVFSPPSTSKANAVTQLPDSHKLFPLHEMYSALLNRSLIHEELLEAYTAVGENSGYYNPFFFFQNDLLCKVEVFTGIVGNAKNDEGSWTLLKKQDLENLSGDQKLFCRLKIYDPVNNKEIDLPILDKYFLIYEGATMDIPDYIPVVPLSPPPQILFPILQAPEETARQIVVDEKSQREMRVWESANYRAINDFRTKTREGRRLPPVMPPYGDIYGPDPDPRASSLAAARSSAMQQGQSAVSTTTQTQTGANIDTGISTPTGYTGGTGGFSGGGGGTGGY